MRPRTAFILDLICLIVFAAVGRHSHHEGFDIGGVMKTAMPFLIGAAVGWKVGRGWRAPRAVTPTGVRVWISTVVVGMLLRLVTGQGVAPSFIVVASVVTALFLLGWRFVVNTVVVLRARG
jgi:hypothetical protein